MSEPIHIVAYDPEWPATFARLRGRLSAAIGDWAVAVEHVGSTAVPGLAAKPILDIDVLVRSTADLAEGIRRLGEFGYVHLGDRGVRGREAFAEPVDTPRHHLYLVALSSEALRNHIDFRDYLRARPEVAKEYGELKRTLAARFRDDRNGYTEAKSAFIEETLRRARAIAKV